MSESSAEAVAECGLGGRRLRRELAQGRDRRRRHRRGRGGCRRRSRHRAAHGRPRHAAARPGSPSTRRDRTARCAAPPARRTPTTAPSCTTRSTTSSPRPRSHGRRRRLFGRKAPAPVTVVFSHGYCLNQDSWHFQRAALRGVVRTVHWDQRSHGRSGRGVAQVEAAQAGHHRPARPRPEGRHRRGRARGADRAGRALHGRHDGDGAGRPVPRPDPRAGRRRRARRYVVGAARRGQLRAARRGRQRGAAGAARRAEGARTAGRPGGAGAAGHGRSVRRDHQAVLVRVPGTSTRRSSGSPSG